MFHNVVSGKGHKKPLEEIWFNCAQNILDFPPLYSYFQMNDNILNILETYIY